MLWLVASIALEAAFNPLSACWNAISYPLQNLLNVLEGDIAQGTKIKDESPVASCNSRNRANLHGCRSHFLVACRRFDREGVFPICQGIAISVLAIPGEVEASRRLGSQIFGLNDLPSSIFDCQFDRVRSALKQRATNSLPADQRQSIAGNHDIFADDPSRLQSLSF